MKVLSIPHLYQLKDSTDGISQVIRAYFKHLPDFGIELVLPDEKDYDLKAVHAGVLGSDCDVAHLHGIYWTADYPASAWEFRANQKIVESLRSALSVTVPSSWVAETIQRDLHLSPFVIPHGIDIDEWELGETGDYILWNKNRAGDVCDPDPVYSLAAAFPKGRFITTFAPKNRTPLTNLHSIGVVHHSAMKKMVKEALVYLATTKETFGIGILEALASGVPVLGFNHGGVANLVAHGLTGFLAPPGNLEALGEGLDFCIKHRKILSQNAREAAKLWPWEDAAEKVAFVYQHTLDTIRQPKSVSVVIPVFNKTPDQLMRAVESVRNQTLTPDSIVVVDDGSESDLSETYQAILQQLAPEVTYIRQENKGVAHARNRGIAETHSTYVCCLDSDDAMKETFLERCCAALDIDQSLGIAYTKIHVIEPSGQEGISKWPGEFDFDRQRQRGNQVPTCCVFRRTAWERTGGYRQRYAPDGAGAEDGELWLRMGALGFNAKLVTPKPLFIYSVGSGQVSGNPDYKEVDWLKWHPWTKDTHHPIASLAKPAFLSHPVRQYDEPVASIIIPVGPGHLQHLWNALDSLEAQTFRRWEAIVVMDYAPPTEEFNTLRNAFPFVKWEWTDLGSFMELGPGKARNIGAEVAHGKFLVFLDADDWLYPEYIEEVLSEWRAGEPAIIYTDYVGKAIVDQPEELAPDLQKRIYSRNSDTNLTIMGFRAADYDCERAQQQPEGTNPWLWTNVTALIPAPWHRDIGGFSEEIPSWEDALYHFKMARRGRCYRRLPEELYVYCLHYGMRREKGRQDFESLLQWIQRELDEEETVACSGCSGSSGKSATTSQTARVLASPTRTIQPVTEEFILCVYNHPNRGDHPVIGGAAFSAPIQGVSMVRVREGFKIHYGNKAGAGQTKFRVHRNDVTLQPHMFIPVQNVEVVGVREEIQPLPPPVETSPPSGILSDLGNSPPKTSAVYPVTGDNTVNPTVIETSIGGKIEQIEVPDQAPPPQSATGLQSLPGIGPATAEAMTQNGVLTSSDILSLSIEELCEYPGIAENRAGMILAAARRFGEREGEPGGILSLEAGL